MSLDKERVDQNNYAFCDKPILFYTEGLGPCIGVCIAWNCWAGIIHSADILLDEAEITALINEAKTVIPSEIVAMIQPVICGGDTEDHSGFVDDPEEFANGILKGRARVVEVLKNAGFGEPQIRWNNPGETAALYADLDASEVYIEVDFVEVGRWPICQK